MLSRVNPLASSSKNKIYCFCEKNSFIVASGSLLILNCSSFGKALK